jgi:CRISPR-associated exonuclease Cas4
MLFFLAVLFLAIAIVLFVLAERGRKGSGLPTGRVVYSDTRSWKALETPLYDATLGLSGRPDYLVEQGRHVIPVEVKSGAAPDSPYESHIFQLAAYCRLVETTYDRRPDYGLLHYPDRTFAVDYTPRLEAALLALLDEMRQCASSDDIPRSHDSQARCVGCGYRSICDQKLG